MARSTHAARALQELLEKEAFRGEVGKLYETVEDFERCPKESKRVVLIGCTGAGKSTLLNIMGGWRFVQSREDDMWSWRDTKGTEKAEPLFKA